MVILSRSAVGVLPRMGTLLLAALTLATYRRRSADVQQAPALLALALCAFSVGTTELVL